MDEKWWTKLTAYLALAVVGGILGHALRTLDKGEKLSWARSILEGLAAGFAGLLIFLLCRTLGVSEEMTGVIVGVGGWLGASATIRRIEPIAFGRFGAKNEDKTVD